MSGLSRERAIAAALTIVDRDGLDGLTMRALGRELRADPMAVYHHLPNKEAILDGVVEAVLSEIPLDPRRRAASLCGSTSARTVDPAARPPARSAPTPHRR